MIRAIIVDDEPLARRGIRQHVARHRDIAVVAECRNGLEASRVLARGEVELAFVDVQMPTMDGFELLGSAAQRESKLQVVFVTAYDHHAARAFDAAATDYLVKPVTAERFDAAMARVRERLAARAALGGHKPSEAEDVDQRLIVPVANGDLVLRVSEIDWIQADDYYAMIHARGRRLLLRESLTSLEERLAPAQFVRVHRSAIVNIDRVKAVRTNFDGASLVLRDGTTVPVSRRRKERVQQLLRSLEQRA